MLYYGVYFLSSNDDVDSNTSADGYSSNKFNFVGKKKEQVLNRILVPTLTLLLLLFLLFPHLLFLLLLLHLLFL